MSKGNLIATIRYLRENLGTKLLLKTEQDVAWLVKKHPLANGYVTSYESFADYYRTLPREPRGFAEPDKSCDIDHTCAGNHKCGGVK